MELTKEKEFDKKALTQQINRVLGKGVISTSLLAMGFAPTVQAYEQNKASGAKTTIASSDRILQPLNLSTGEGSKFDRSSTINNRRSAVNTIGALRKSEDFVAIQNMQRNLGISMDGGQTNNQWDEVLSKGILFANRDKASLALDLSSGQVASSPQIQMTLQQPMVLSLHDPQNDVGTIILIESKRHSDGSATMYQRFIGPRYFDEVADGGGLSEKEHEIMESVFDGNIAEGHKNTGKYRHSFTQINSRGLMTIAGLVMQRHGATLGLHTNHFLDKNYWKTESGTFRVTITHHMETLIKPNWQILVPRDEMEGGLYPFFTLKKDNGEYTNVVGGINVLSTEDFASSFDFDPFLIDYRKKKEKGWSGFAMAIFAAIAVVAIVATGGALGVIAPSISPMIAGALTFGVVGGVSLASGTFSSMTTTSAGNFTSVTDKKSTEAPDGFFEQSNAIARQITLDGALDSSSQSTGRTNRAIVDQWSHLVDPIYTNGSSDNQYEYKGVNINIQEKPDTSKMFDNIHDNPDYGNNSNACSGLFVFVRPGGRCSSHPGRNQ